MSGWYRGRGMGVTETLTSGIFVERLRFSNLISAEQKEIQTSDLIWRPLATWKTIFFCLFVYSVDDIWLC